MAAGIVAGRTIGRRGAHTILLAAMLVQGGLTALIILVGTQSNWLWLLLPALFGGFFGHITAVVAATVTATSEVPDTDKGLASGLVTTSQRVAVTIGIPVLGCGDGYSGRLLYGIRLALAVNVAYTLTAVIMIRAGLNSLRPSGSLRSYRRFCRGLACTAPASPGVIRVAVSNTVLTPSCAVACNRTNFRQYYSFSGQCIQPPGS